MSSLRDAFLDDGDIIVYQGDCIEVMREMAEASVDAIITDPPYGIGFMGKDWDTGGRMIGQLATGHEQRGAFAYGGSHDRGYADNDSRAFQAFSEAWAREAFRVLKPGGHLLAFAGTRTYHRMASGVEDAGFEIRDCIAWMYGSGFPKSLDVSKAIDKRGGVTAAFAEFRDAVKDAMKREGIKRSDLQAALGNHMLSHYLTAGSQPAIPNWRDYQIIRDKVFLGDRYDDLFMPEAEREVIGISSHKSGITNGASGHTTVGGTVAEHYHITAPATPAAAKWSGWGTALKPAFEPIVVARKPLIGTVAENVLEHGTGALNIDECRIGTDVVGWQGEGRSEDAATSKSRENTGGYGFASGAARPVSGRWPANVALDEQAAAMLDEQSGTSASNQRIGKRTGKSEGRYGRFDGQPEAVMGHSDTGGASRFFYTAKASRQDRNQGGLADNTHPTVKPTELMRWLIRLTTPPDGIILDPFGGSGSTGVAARAENTRCILIERETEYLHIIRDRLAQQSLFSEGHRQA